MPTLKTLNGRVVGADAITHNDSGTPVVPSTDEDWLDWVGATSTRNYLLHDPLIDWLDAYGAQNGFQQAADISGYDSRTDFTEYIFRKAHEFEAALLTHLKTLTTVVTVSSDRGDVRNLARAEDTFRAMDAGALVIYQGVRGGKLLVGSGTTRPG